MPRFDIIGGVAAPEPLGDPTDDEGLQLVGCLLRPWLPLHRMGTRDLQSPQSISFDTCREVVKLGIAVQRLRPHYSPYRPLTLESGEDEKSLALDAYTFGPSSLGASVLLNMTSEYEPPGKTLLSPIPSGLRRFC